MRWSSILFILSALLIHSACSPTVAPEVDDPPPKVHVVGCAELRAGPICRPRSDEQLTLWIEPGGLQQVVGPLGVKSSRTKVDHGIRIGIAIPPDLNELKFTLRAEDGPVIYTLQLDRTRPEPLLAAEAKLADQDYAGVLSILRTATLSSDSQAWIHALRAKAFFRMGESAKALAANGHAVDAAQAAGLWSLAIEKSAALVYLNVEKRDFVTARAVLKKMRTITPDDGLAQMHTAYSEALLALDTGDFRAVTAALTVLDRWMDRLQMGGTFQLGVTMIRIHLFTWLGRAQEALALSLPFLKTLNQMPACQQVETLSNIAWVASMIETNGGNPSIDPIKTLQRALPLLQDNQCASVKYTRLNLAQTLVQRGRAGEARQYLNTIDKKTDMRVRNWHEVLLGQVELAMGHTVKALAAFERVITQEESLMAREVRRQAVLGRAEALAALNRVDEATVAFAQAEALIDSQSLLVPIGGALHGFIGDRERGSRAYISFLVAQNQPGKALQVARRARARVLARLRQQNLVAELKPAEQKSWDEALKAYRAARAELDQRARTDRLLPADEQPAAAATRKALETDAQNALDKAYHALGDHPLPDPRPPIEGELLLAYVQGADRWFGFAATTSGVLVKPLEFGPKIKTDAQKSAALLEPFRAQIVASRVLTFLPQGHTRRIDFHALPWIEGALAQSVPVQYGLDFAPTRARKSSQRALLISDPLGDLQASREEAKVVQNALTSRLKLTVKHLAGHSATLAAVREQLPGSQLFHFAGHGVHGGAAGWESELRLSGETRLTVGDVLTLKSAPEVVVLSACEGGASEATGGAEALGLAQAFVAAGSRAVIAATREVDSALALQLSAALYAQDSFPANPAAALQGATTILQAKVPNADWATFRVIVP